MHKHAKLEGFGGILHQEMRCSEIALGPFWDVRKPSRSSYMGRRVSSPLFGCPRVHVLSQLTLHFHKTMY